jgi:uncharacterized protein YbbC (DUF1343 family)
MTQTGLDQIRHDTPGELAGKRVGILCHAPSVASDYTHITTIFRKKTDCDLVSVFGPQHGLYGQTQDNMIEWRSSVHPLYRIPVYSLYGEHRKPTPEMLAGLDAFIIDLQDVGARLYTYVWTVKLCMEACAEAGIPVWILDRPNPVGLIQFDGPVLKEDYFTFVGGASIPLCHRMTLGEMALWIREKHSINCSLKIVWMKNWRRQSLFDQTGLPWILPSPNMPTLSTAIVYPGMVLAEALNMSEGRGTTIPFELSGAPYIDSEKMKFNLDEKKIPGCVFRVHNFIPTFNKYSGQVCNGLQIHVTDPSVFLPVMTAYEVFSAVIETSPPGSLKFNDPPYEYEYKLMPFDILSGDSIMRSALLNGVPARIERERWKDEIEQFEYEFRQLSAYPE